MKISNEELVKFLIENRTDEDGNIDLSNIDFGDRVVFNNGQVATRIYNNGQKANIIFNHGQQSTKIYNNGQEANDIYNDGQEANAIYNDEQEAIKISNGFQEATKIYNENQVIKPNYETMSKEELIKELKKLKGEQ